MIFRRALRLESAPRADAVARVVAVPAAVRRPAGRRV